jgi:hypothetical protein
MQKYPGAVIFGPEPFADLPPQLLLSFFGCFNKTGAPGKNKRDTTSSRLSIRLLRAQPAD